jgi:hypothetical protein
LPVPRAPASYLPGTDLGEIVDGSMITVDVGIL